MTDSTMQLYDMDHALMPDGNIYRVLGNFKSDSHFLGYKLYSPSKNGDRDFRGQRYIKNYTEETTLTDDVLTTYDVIDKKDIIEHFEPIATAQRRMISLEGTVWFDLYGKLVEFFGKDSIGIFGSALPGLHLNNEGSVKNDVDFFIEGLDNAPTLETHLYEVREELGFTDYDPDVQENICTTWKKVFRNSNTSFDKIIDRRWSGMQLTTDTGKVLNTFRFRDKENLTSLDLIDPGLIRDKNIRISGTVTESLRGNLYPRIFTVSTDDGDYEVYSMWWKFSSPVANNDSVTVCGNLVELEGKEVLLMTNYVDHWIQIH